MAIRNRSGRGPPTAWIGCADVEGNTFHAGLPQRWAPQGIMATRGAQRPYDVHPDGRRIVMKRPPEMEARCPPGEMRNTPPRNARVTWRPHVHTQRDHACRSHNGVNRRGCARHVMYSLDCERGRRGRIRDTIVNSRRPARQRSAQLLTDAGSGTAEGFPRTKCRKM
jgi:hypothetical protein